MTDFEKIIKDGGVFVVGMHEFASDGVAFNLLFLTSPQELKTVLKGNRASFLLNTYAWMEIMKPVLEANTDPNIMKIMSNGVEVKGAPPINELFPLAEKSLSFMREFWPYEAEVVDSVIKGKDGQMIAVLALMPYIRQGGLNRVEQLLPDEAPGVIYRANSPIGFFPHSKKPDSDEQITISSASSGPIYVASTSEIGEHLQDIIRVLTGKPPQEVDATPDFEFPVPKEKPKNGQSVN